MEYLAIAAVAFILGFVLAKTMAKLAAPGAGVAAETHEKAVRENAALAAQVEGLNTQRDDLRDELAAIRSELLAAREQAAAAGAEKKALMEKQADMESLHQQMKLQFEQMAGKIFEANTQRLSEMSKASLKDSQETLASLLNPLKERMSEFQSKVDQSFGQASNEQRSLKEEIQRIVMSSDGLTKALKGDVKAQGNWGEVILERILEDAGLERGRDYVLQGEGLAMRHVEDGSAQKPDVVIHLPEGKHVIVDAKVSLTHYERFCSEMEEVQRGACLKQYLNSIRSHVKGLAERRYHDNEKMRTPECVLMFMPIEGAFSLAMQEDRELHAYAWDKKVAIVCPTTLFVTLQTVASLWRMEKINRNVEEIARRGGELYDKFALFTDSMQSIGRQLGQAQNAYDQALNRLVDGKGSVVRQVEMLKTLGAKASKQLPKEWLDAAEEPALTLVVGEA